jgi:hypothetical protein
VDKYAGPGTSALVRENCTLLRGKENVLDLPDLCQSEAPEWIALDEAADDHRPDRCAGDAGAFQLGVGSDAEQQDALGSGACGDLHGAMTTGPTGQGLARLVGSPLVRFLSPGALRV